MTKRLAIAFSLGVLTPLVFALYLGGERLAVMGFRLQALENGVALARSEWTVDGVPALQVSVAQASDAAPIVTKKATGARRR